MTMQTAITTNARSSTAYLSSFAPPLGNVLPILMTMLHSHMAGLGPELVSGQQQPLDFLDEHVGVARLDDDLVEAGLARAIELPRRANSQSRQ